jgi:putative zinc finger/helix-turn-helix YgiT family protein
MKKIKKDYQYSESGLDNIILGDTPMYICECGEEMPIISHIESLNRVIAFELIKLKNHLTGKEARFIRKQLGMKAVQLAEILGVDKVTVSRWENDNNPIGNANDRLIRLLYLTKMAEELKQMVPIETLTEIMSNISSSLRKSSRKHAMINVPTSKIAGYDFGLAHC